MDFGSWAEFSFNTVAAADACEDKATLETLVGDAFSRLGATVYVGVDARGTLTGQHVRVSFGRTAPAWEAHYFAHGHAAHDVVLTHILSSSETRYWSELVQTGEPLLPRQRQVFDEAREFGFLEGLAIPIHHPGGVTSAVLLMGQDLCANDLAHRHAAQMVSHAFSRAARRLGIDEERRTADRPRLSRREAETLYWVRKGATDKIAAIAMALAPPTVTGYIRSAEEKLGVSGREVAAELAQELGLLPPFVSPSPNRPSIRPSTPTGLASA